MSKITLEQWRVLKAVVEFGGFTQAAEELHKSQSSISYSVTKLQQQLGFPILVMEGRKAKLTQRGQVLLEQSKALLQQSDQLELLASTLGDVQEDDLHLYVDSCIPYSVILDTIVRYTTISPNVNVIFHEVLPSEAPSKNINNQSSSIKLSSTSPSATDLAILELELVAVVSNSHRLVSNALTDTYGFENEHQIALASTIEKTEEDKSISLVSNTALAIEMVKRGFGYAWLPMCEVQNLLKQGELVRLKTTKEFSSTRYVYASSFSLNNYSAINLFIKTLKESCEQ